MIGREKPGMQSEVARLISETLEQEKKQQQQHLDDHYEHSTEEVSQSAGDKASDQSSTNECHVQIRKGKYSHSNSLYTVMSTRYVIFCIVSWHLKCCSSHWHYCTVCTLLPPDHKLTVEKCPSFPAVITTWMLTWIVFTAFLITQTLHLLLCCSQSTPTHINLEYWQCTADCESVVCHRYAAVWVIYSPTGCCLEFWT